MEGQYGVSVIFCFSQDSRLIIQSVELFTSEVNFEVLFPITVAELQVVTFLLVSFTCEIIPVWRNMVC